MIDGGNDQSWPEDVVQKLARFRQGSLIARPPFAYHASARAPLWKATRLLPPDPSAPDVDLVELDPDDRPPYGIITTQSCDIDEEGRNRKPWVQIAPVYPLDVNHPSLGQVRRWRIPYLAPVPTLGLHWVADLRIEFPVEKGWLIEQEPSSAFTDDADFDEFAQHCGRHRSRPGLATSIYDDVLTPLHRELQTLWATDAELAEAFSRQVAHLYVSIGGDRLAPRAVELILVSQDPLPAALVDRLNSWWADHFGGRQSLAYTVLPTRYLTFGQVSFAESRHWFEQDLARLTASS